MLMLNIFAFSTSAHADCSDKGKVIIGKLKHLSTHNSRGARVDRFYLLPKRKLCVVADRKGNKSMRYVRQLEIFPSNARIKDLKNFKDLRVAIRGTIYRKDRSRDAIAKKAVILGAYDPRNNRFHNWKKLANKLSGQRGRPEFREDREPRYADRRRNERRDDQEYARREPEPRRDLESRRRREHYDNERRRDIEERLRREERQARREEDRRLEEDTRRWHEGPSTGSIRRDRDDDSYSPDDSTGLTGLIKRSLRDYPADQTDYPSIRRKGSYTGNALFGEILDFVTDDYLQFHQMRPADVVEFYTRYVDFNGDTGLEREHVVREKFRGFRNGPRQRYKLYNRTLTVNKSSALPDVYYVKFQYGIGRRSHEDTLWVRKQVRLTLDMGTDYVQIRREKVRTIARNQQ